jgi:hypothetical protein
MVKVHKIETGYTADHTGAKTPLYQYQTECLFDFDYSEFTKALGGEAFEAEFTIEHWCPGFSIKTPCEALAQWCQDKWGEK